MNIEFAGRKIDVRERIVDPGRIRPNDFIQVESVLVKCVARQGGCPIWESNRLVVVYLFETETGARFSMRDLKGKFTVLRTKKGK
jgi:hypothetical protein